MLLNRKAWYFGRLNRPGPPSFVALWNGGLGLAIRSSGGVPIVATHLASQALGAPDRVRQLSSLLPWVATQGTPRILVGDFNALPTAPELQPISAAYHDAWADAVQSGTARGRIDGITHQTDRIDFVFYSPGAGIQLLWAETVDTFALVGREASDHRPLVAAFAFR